MLLSLGDTFLNGLFFYNFFLLLCYIRLIHP